MINSRTFQLKLDDTHGSGTVGFDFSISLSLSSDTSRSVTLRWEITNINRL